MGTSLTPSFMEGSCRIADARAVPRGTRGKFLEMADLADSPPPCGEGLGGGGVPTADVLRSPPPCHSPTRGEGTPALGSAFGDRWPQSERAAILEGMTARWGPRGGQTSDPPLAPS